MVVAAVVVRAVLEDVMATVVLELPFRPDLTRIAAIVTAARNAAGAPYRVSCSRLRGSTAVRYQPDTAHTSRAYFEASAAAALRQSIPETRKA